MNKKLHSLAIVAAAALLVGTLWDSSAVAQECQAPPESALFGTWHRLNPRFDISPLISPEHEVLRFHIQADMWVGRYDKMPEETLGFENPPEGTFGRFTGFELPLNAFTCASAFPFNCPSDVAFVVEGSITFAPPSGVSFTVQQQLIVTNAGTLYVFWVDPGNFICPWFRTFEEALSRNPFPLPFNGVDQPVQDCIFSVF